MRPANLKIGAGIIIEAFPKKKKKKR